ncbi:MAG: DUF3299 domain-containing protein [Oligoflexia bacterium]|nr:DUF3299 domain-containing protein [Oligoflexia bacterium]
MLVLWSATAQALSDPEVPWKTLGRLAFRPSNPPDEVRRILNKPVQVIGFMMADEFNSDEVTEFFLMPVSRGCPHVPPPPPSYVIHAKMKASGSTQFHAGAVKVHGVLSLTKNSENEFAYSYEMIADSVEAAPKSIDHFD